MAGLLLAIPDLVALDLPALVTRGRLPRHPRHPAPSAGCCPCWRSSSPRTRRVSHVDDLLLPTPAAALFAGLAVLPKKSALTDYSYRLAHDHQRGSWPPWTPR